MLLSVSLPSPLPSARAEVITMESLPECILSHIGLFAAGGWFGGSCKATLEAMPALHYKIDIAENALSFGRQEDPAGTKARAHMSLPPTPGALATGRVVTRISVTGCIEREDSNGGYKALEGAVRRVVQHSISSLQSILVQGDKIKGCGAVAVIIGELVPVSLKRWRVAKKLTRVVIRHGASGMFKAGNAIRAGLWPSLEELVVQHCHSRGNHMGGFVDGVRSGHVPNLRVLTWDHQSSPFTEVDDVVLAALSTGKCPRIECLSFTNNDDCPNYILRSLGGALRACPELRKLRMDCDHTSADEVQDLIEALRAGDAPRLTSLHIWVPMSVDKAVELETLRNVARSRRPAVLLEVGCR